MDRDGFVFSVLKENGILNEKQAKKAQSISLHSGKGLLDIAKQQNWVTDAEVRDLLAAKFSMDTVDLREQEIPKDLIGIVPSKLARRYQTIPVEKQDNLLKVAISDPFRLEAVDSLTLVLGMQVEAVLATSSDILKALRKYYGYDDVLGGVSSEIRKKQGENSGPVSYEGAEALKEEISEEAPVIRLVSLIISEAFRRRASDVHLEPMGGKFRIRYRVDGILHEVDSPPKHLQNSIISRIKIMANMSIDEKRLPQDGRIKLKIFGRDIDLRVSTLPSNHGESVVMRILDRESLLLGLPQLGLRGEDDDKFKKLIERPNGIILVTGPTGSGKTTTLYACLNYINKPDTKIITVENPVEYLLSGINQVQVNEEIDLTFANILRSILRQAPDVIMIGEIRDLETANIAIHASLTGHLVFSTLHTNDASSAVTRLVDQGVKPFLVASSVQGIMAQRLVRVICPKCKKQYVPTDVELRSIGIDPVEAKEKDMKFWHGTGCSYCNETGYYGRMGIFELLVMNDDLRKLIYENVSSTEIFKRAKQTGMNTLKEDGLIKVHAGITTIEEVLRVAVQ